MKDVDTISIEDALAAIELDDICMSCTDWSGYTTEPVRDRVWEVADEYAKGDEATLLEWLKDPQNKGAILEAEDRDIFRVEFDITNIELELAEGTLTRDQQLRVAAVGRSIANEEHLYANMGDIYLYQALEELRRGGMSEVPTGWIEGMRKWLEDDYPMTFDDWRDDGPGMPEVSALKADIANRDGGSPEMGDYERYQLSWMIEHGHSIKDLIDGLNQVDLDGLDDMNDVFELWAENYGFKGEVFLSREEFTSEMAAGTDLDTLTECARMASEDLDTGVCETGTKEL